MAWSTFPNQKKKITPFSDHFWKLQCRKSARRCGAKQFSKSKCAKHAKCGLLLEVKMSKKCTPLWRKAHFEVKILKTPGVWTTFGGSNVASLHYLTGHYTTLYSSTLHHTKLHYTTQWNLWELGWHIHYDLIYIWLRSYLWTDSIFLNFS